MKQSKETSVYLPRFTIGEGAFEQFETHMSCFGRQVAIVYGEKAWRAARDYVLPALDQAGMQVCAQVLYGHNATFEQVRTIVENPDVERADMLIAVGGGKCMDTVKLAADHMNKPIFTIPSIASNCAPVTQISIMYHEDGSFREIPRLNAVPVHCFIHPRIILNAPIQYLWAGIGDAMAKHVESQWSAKAGELLDYGSEFGIIASRMCFYPMLTGASKALNDARDGVVSEELKETILKKIIYMVKWSPTEVW